MTSQTFDPVSGPIITPNYASIYWQQDAMGQMLKDESAMVVPVKIKGIVEPLVKPGCTCLTHKNTEYTYI